MIYVPILKNREQEMKVSYDLKWCFSKNIIPLFEIINEEYQERFLTDKETGKIVYEKRPGNTNRTKVKLDPAEDDIITLQNIQKRLDNNMAFVDYFRFKEEEYPKVDINLESIKLSLILSRNFDLYQAKLLDLSHYDNLVPVISIKKQFPIGLRELENLIVQMQEKKPVIAIRITAEIIDDYKDIVKKNLRIEDYLMIDIREQSIDARIMELTDIEELHIEAKVILLNSPRKLSIKNNQYEEFGFTDLIDNSALERYREYNFDGVGDYGGLKDTLPERNAGDFGKGYALALLYMHGNNQFFSLMNNDSNLGPSGYHGIKTRIVKEKMRFDTDDDCPGFDKLKKFKKAGGWKEWNYITLARYIHQIYKSI